MSDSIFVDAVVSVGLVLLQVALALPWLAFVTQTPLKAWVRGDKLMMGELGFDLIMLLPVLFGVMSASSSISEEIEGRTAVTLMSKPVSRRQFLLGKYIGILLAAFVITNLLGWVFNWVILAKHWFDKLDPVQPPFA